MNEGTAPDELEQLRDADPDAAAAPHVADPEHADATNWPADDSADTAGEVDVADLIEQAKPARAWSEIELEEDDH